MSQEDLAAVAEDPPAEAVDAPVVEPDDPETKMPVRVQDVQGGILSLSLSIYLSFSLFLFFVSSRTGCPWLFFFLSLSRFVTGWVRSLFFFSSLIESFLDPITAEPDQSFIEMLFP